MRELQSLATSESCRSKKAMLELRKAKKAISGVSPAKTYLQDKKDQIEQLAAKYEGISPEIYGVVNQGGEELLFNETITITNSIELWLKQLELYMRYAVAESIRNAVINLQNELNADNNQGFLLWVDKWPT
jgi:hypothetical protein